MMERTRNMGDSHLWAVFKSGSEEAFVQIYKQYSTVLFSYGLRLCNDRELVKDCIQNLFVELWNKRHDDNQVTSLKFYLLKILKRKIMKELGGIESDRGRLGSWFSSSPDFQATLSPELSIIEEEVSKEVYQSVLRAFHSLAPRQKEVVFLRFYENLSYEEIASIMDFGHPKYARQLIYRTLDELRKILKTSKAINTIPLSSILVLLCFFY